MTALVAAVCVAAYLAVAAWSMRWLYGRWRAKNIDKYAAMFGGAEKGRAYYEERWAGETKLGAAAAGFAWPVTLPTMGFGALLARFMDTAPVVSRAEREAERDVLRKRIAELERELGIGDGRG